MKEKPEEHDVIIIGGGVSGCYLASKLKGFDVLVLEKSRQTKKDSGIVSTRFDSLVGNKSLVFGNINEMEFVSPARHVFSMKSSNPIAYRLDREGLELHLRGRAGKKLRYERAESIGFGRDSATVETQQGSYSCNLLVGADGALSAVRNACGFRRPKIFYGLISEQQRPELEGKFRVHLNKHYSPDFFSWELSNEYGLVTAKRPLEYFGFFRKKEGLAASAVAGAPIPVGFTRSFRDNCILVGDSCGQTKPLTGGGLIFSMLAARHAADVIRRAFEEDYFKADLLGLYERKWQMEIGWEIRKQLFFRSMYRRLTNAAIDRLFLDFGKHLEDVASFDYDQLSRLAYKMPKWKLLKNFLSIAAGI